MNKILKRISLRLSNNGKREKAGDDGFTTNFAG
jgi:hypothetical protein